MAGYQQPTGITTAGAPEEMQSVLQHALTELRSQVLKAATESLPTQHQTKIKSIYANLFRSNCQGL